MNPDLDTLATTVYVTVDDLLIQHPEWVPQRPAVGIAPKLSDAELVTLAVIQSLLRYTSEARFLRYAHAHLGPWFPYLPTRSAYNRRLRRLGLTMQHIIAWLARDCPSWHDDLWLVDSTPVECGRSRTTQQRSARGDGPNTATAPPTPATSGGCASTWWPPHRDLPIAFALAPAKADERDIATEMIAHARLARAGQTLMADKGYRSASFEEDLNEAHMTLIRPATKTEAPRSGQRFLRPFRQITESIFQTFKGQLDLERHGGRTKAGVVARVLQPILALTTVIWHNETTQRPGPARSLIAYDH